MLLSHWVQPTIRAYVASEGTALHEIINVTLNFFLAQCILFGIQLIVSIIKYPFCSGRFTPLFSFPSSGLGNAIFNVVKADPQHEPFTTTEVTRPHLELLFDGSPNDTSLIEGFRLVALGTIIHRHNNCSVIWSDSFITGDLLSKDAQ
jgi:hypothetical protein